MVMVMILFGRPEFSMYVTATKKEQKKEGSFYVSESTHSRTSSAKSKRPREQKNRKFGVDSYLIIHLHSQMKPH